MDFTITSSQFDTQQGEPLGEVLFTLTHFRTFHPIATTHLTCVFPLLVSDTHIICRNPTLAKCGGEAQHFQSWGLGVLRDSRMFRVRQQGPNTSH